MPTNHSTGHETTWRELAHQLSAEQLRELEAAERHRPELASRLLPVAFGHALRNALAARFADVPVPPNADPAAVSHWTLHGDGRCVRRFSVDPVWVIALPEPDGGAEVEVVGEQFSDGRVSWHVEVGGDGLDCLGVAGARELAAALLDAAEVIDQRTDATA